jgi:predicted nuclease of predicted toxin-antitoxin system
MRFSLDANMPRSAVSALVGLGHLVEFCRDIGMANDRDEAIAARARETQAALITRELDFADIRRYPPEQHAGIVVLRRTTQSRLTSSMSWCDSRATRFSQSNSRAARCRGGKSGPISSSIGVRLKEAATLCAYSSDPPMWLSTPASPQLHRRCNAVREVAMRINAKSEIVGVVAIKVRDYLRQAQGHHFAAHNVAGGLKISAMRAQAVLNELLVRKYVEKAEPSKLEKGDYYICTHDGVQFAAAMATKPVSRSTADRHIAELIERIHAVLEHRGNPIAPAEAAEAELHPTAGACYREKGC